MKQKSMNDCSYFFPLFSLSICSIRCRLAIVPVVTTIDQFVYLIFYVRGFIIKRFILDRINGTYSKNINVNVFRRQEEMSTSIVVFRYCKHDCFPITQIELVIHKTDDPKRVLTKENSYMKVDLPIHRIIIPIRCEKKKILMQTTRNESAKKKMIVSLISERHKLITVKSISVGLVCLV